jgi:transposase
MSDKRKSAIAVIGIDIGKYSFHIVCLDERGAIVLRQKWSRSQVDARLANVPPCLIGMEACVGAHHLSRQLKVLGHDARLMPAKYVRPYSKGQKNDFRDAEAIAEAVQRPTELERDQHADIFVSTILEGPSKWTVRPVAEFFYEREFDQFETVSAP